LDRFLIAQKKKTTMMSDEIAMGLMMLLSMWISMVAVSIALMFDVAAVAAVELMMVVIHVLTLAPTMMKEIFVGGIVGQSMWVKLGGGWQCYRRQRSENLMTTHWMKKNQVEESVAEMSLRRCVCLEEVDLR
jgi:hypothetical protein